MKIIYFLLILFLTSCVELIDDLKINLDGSGTFKYTLNLSSSKTKVSSILALDSLNGKKVLSKTDIQEKILNFKKSLIQQEGITNVVITEDYENYIFKILIDFKNVEDLEKGLKTSINKLYEFKQYNHDWISFKDKTLVRDLPNFYDVITTDFIGLDIDKLKTGSYTSITRFNTTINNFENKNCIKSKTNTALMIKVTPDIVFNNTKIFNNSITLDK